MTGTIHQRDGFVLFSVIWIAALLAVIATTFAISARVQVKSQANLAQSYQAEAAADGIARLIGMRLAQGPLDEKSHFILPMDGQASSCELDGEAQAIISLQDQAGLVDLNQASPATLKSVLGRIGIPETDLIARAIVDFRDQDDAAFEGNGSEVSLVAGGPGLKNAAFQSVDEIAQVIPENMADLSVLSSYFTVYSLQAGVDPTIAPARLKALLDAAGGSLDSASRIPTALSPRKAFAIDVQVKLASDVTFRRIAVVTLLRLPERPFAILEWRQGEMAQQEKEVASLNTPCEALVAR